MKTLVVYYSRSGHTRALAREIASRCHADTEAIQEYTGRAGWKGYLVSLLQSLEGSTVPLAPSMRAPADYDLVVIGTPVWAWNIASPVRAYIQRHRSQLHRVAFFCTQADRGAERAFATMGQLCAQTPVACLTLSNDDAKRGHYRRRLKAFSDELRNHFAADDGSPAGYAITAP